MICTLSVSLCMVSNFSVPIVHQLIDLPFAKVAHIGEIKRIYFPFLSVNGIAISNVFSNASGKI